MVSTVEARGSVSFLDSFKDKHHPEWTMYQNSKPGTPEYSLLHNNGSLILDGTKVATANSIQVGFTRTINKLKDKKVFWQKLVFDFRSKILDENYGPQENNIHVEIFKHNTSVHARKIYDGSDEALVKKYTGSNQYDSNWQTYTVDLSDSNIKRGSKLTINIFTLQNAFRPVKSISIRNVYIIRSPIPGEENHHLPDDHELKRLP